MPKLKGKRVLVTGGAGFIGSHVVDRVLQENPKSVTVSDNLFWGQADNLAHVKEEVELIVEDAGECCHYDYDVVFDLAVLCLPISLTQPDRVYATNTQITRVMCESVRIGGVGTLIHFSSSEAYGTAEKTPMNEDHPLHPRTPYAASKAAGDHLVLSYCRTFGIDAAILRPFNVYGPRQNSGDYAALIPLTIRRLREGKPPIIQGDGLQCRDFSFVTDIADAAVRMYETVETRGKVVNVASGMTASVRDIVGCLQYAMGTSLEPQVEPERPGDVRQLIGDASLARKLFGYSPKVGIEVGLERTVRYYVR